VCELYSACLWEGCYAGPDGAPPSYEQIFGMSQMKREVQEARESSSNKGVFAFKFFSICCGSSELLRHMGV